MSGWWQCRNAWYDSRIDSWNVSGMWLDNNHFLLYAWYIYIGIHIRFCDMYQYMWANNGNLKNGYVKFNTTSTSRIGSPVTLRHKGWLPVPSTELTIEHPTIVFCLNIWSSPVLPNGSKFSLTRVRIWKKNIWLPKKNISLIHVIRKYKRGSKTPMHKLTYVDDLPF